MAVDPSTKVRHLSLHPSAFLNMGRFLERNIASNERERMMSLVVAIRKPLEKR